MSTPKKHHIAARMGHWSATHRKTAIFGWLGFVIVAFAIGTFVVTQQQIVYETSARRIGTGREDPLRGLQAAGRESILIQHPELRATNPAFQAVVRDAIARVESLDAIAKVESPFDAENTGLVSDDRRSVLIGLEIAGESDKAVDKIDPVVAQVKEVQSANPEFYVGSVGESTGKAVNEAFFEDLAKAGLISIPITLIILIVAFGALVARGSRSCWASRPSSRPWASSRSGASGFRWRKPSARWSC